MQVVQYSLSFLSKKNFHFCPFTLDWKANELTMCRSHWT